MTARRLEKTDLTALAALYAPFWDEAMDEAVMPATVGNPGGRGAPYPPGGGGRRAAGGFGHGRRL